MQTSKLVFSDTELQFAQSKDVILTKTAIIQKVYEQFGSLGNDVFEYFLQGYREYHQELSVLPKISKGENYKGFPWVMLDYPRHFCATKGHLALRNFFWWGHYYLIQLQLSGQYKQKTLNQLKGGVIPNQIKGLPVWIGYPSDPWNYELPQEGIIKMDKGFDLKPYAEKEILKMMVAVPIQDSEKLKEIALTLCNWV